MDPWLETWALTLCDCKYDYMQYSPFLLLSVLCVVVL
jgi:hypothetical protein